MSSDTKARRLIEERLVRRRPRARFAGWRLLTRGGPGKPFRGLSSPNVLILSDLHLNLRPA
jgi:hypothetical protein